MFNLFKTAKAKKLESLVGDIVLLTFSYNNGNTYKYKGVLVKTKYNYTVYSPKSKKNEKVVYELISVKSAKYCEVFNKNGDLLGGSTADYSIELSGVELLKSDYTIW